MHNATISVYNCGFWKELKGLKLNLNPQVSYLENENG